MDLNKYQRECLETSRKYKVYAGEGMSLAVIVLGLLGEIGELVEESNREDKILELGDILCYLTIVIKNKEITLQEIYEEIDIDKLEKEEFNNVICNLIKECSKISEPIKKYYRDGKNINRETIKNAAIGVLKNILILSNILETSIEKIIIANRIKLINKEDNNSLQVK